jgi:hypothetical protein
MSNPMIHDRMSSAEAKASRLLRVRNLANLDRRCFTELCDVNLHTYRGWEVGRHGGLSQKGAMKVILSLKSVNVDCTVEWLLYGIGHGPRIMKDDEGDGQQKLMTTDSFLTGKKEDRLLMHELQYFREHHPNTLDMFVEDDGMFPFYKMGELVAGVRYFGSQINSVIDHSCIVQTKTGLLLLRQLRRGNQPNHYNLVCLNSNTLVEEPLIYNAELVSVAPVVWVRRR